MVLMRTTAIALGVAPSSMFFAMAFARLQTIFCWPACHQFPPERKSAGSSFRCCLDELQGKAGPERVLVRQRALARSILTLILKQALFALRAPATKSHETARNTGLVRSYFVRFRGSVSHRNLITWPSALF